MRPFLASSRAWLSSVALLGGPLVPPVWISPALAPPARARLEEMSSKENVDTAYFFETDCTISDLEEAQPVGSWCVCEGGEVVN